MDLDWRQFLTGRRAREDVYETFPPEDRTDWQPALVNDPGPLSALHVAARLLQIVARRGGTRVGTDDVDALLDVVESAAPDGTSPQCDDEAARILDWLETAEQVPPDERDHESLPPELDIMLGTELEKRVSVARMAIEEGYDLELEYFDEATQTWPRFRCRPVAIEAGDADDDKDDEHDERDDDRDDETTDAEAELASEGPGGPVLRVERWDEERALPLQTIRWLMPVERKPEPREEAVRDKLADVLDFPGAEAGDDPRSQDERDGGNGGDRAAERSEDETATGEEEADESDDN